jgi:hypothetical protein
MPRKRASLRKWTAIAVCLAVGLVCSIMPAATGLWWRWHDRLLAAYCEDALATAGGAEARALLQYLTTLRRPGLAVVVRALAAPETATRTLAYYTLDEKLARYETAPTSADASAWLADLAQALAENAKALPPPALHQAGKLMMRLLALSDEAPAGDRAAVVACCQGVLVAAALQRRPPKPSGAALKMMPRHRPGRAAKLSQTSSAAHGPPSLDLDLSQLAAPTLARADSPGTSVYAEPGFFQANDAAALVSKQKPPTGGQDQVTVAAYTQEVDGSQAAEDQRQAARRRARELDAIELFAQLNESGPVAAASRAELDARGFSPRQVEVGQHLTSHNAAERLQWAEWLPGIRGIDARFWLLRLSHDPNAQVRRAAVGLLATDRDPEVLRRLQRVVVDETDDRIRDQASRALEQLDGE